MECGAGHFAENASARRKTWFTSGADNHFGGEGDDTLNGRSGHDQLHGGGGNDTIEGGRDGDGNPVDQVFLVGVASGLVTVDDIEHPDVEFVGDDGVDVFDRTDADETVATQGGDDVINAGAGNDELNGGAGNDLLTGGSGADLIELDFGDGIDTMTDFEDGIDIIDLSETGLAFADLTIADGADGAHITYETDAGGVAIGELILTGITADVLSEDDFHFG